MGICEEIRSMLFERRDEKYVAFQLKLTPTMTAEDFIGVRTPELRSLVKELSKREDIGEFLSALPHRYFDENQLHSFLLCEEKDYARCLVQVEAFLPYVDNWATCDQLNPKVFAKHKAELLPEIDRWLVSGKTYTVRFGIEMLMNHFLDADFRVEQADKVAALRSEEYYVNMMIAWYFATALAKHYEEVLPFLTEDRLAVWTHNKTIQKANESFRITAEQKEYLKTLKRK